MLPGPPPPPAATPPRAKTIAVLSGVSPDEEIVTSGLFKLRTGVAVLVNNSVQPGNNPAAKPEDR